MAIEVRSIDQPRRRLSGKQNVPDTTPPTVPIREPEFLPSRDASSSPLRATWLGHACYYVEFSSGLRVLFDPVFSHRCSPFQWLGPQRYTKAPCEIEDVPLVDAVCISHSHYDHMDHPTIMRLARKHSNLHFFVPLRSKEIFVGWGIDSSKVTELDWWEERELKFTPGRDTKVGSKEDISTPDSKDVTAKISALPCQHMSARGPFDKARTLWSSWSVESGGKKVWFAGDTGYR